jgi:hypothetical protein
VESVQEGLYNLPKAYGCEVRPQGKVTGWKSGLKAGHKVGKAANLFRHEIIEPF